MTPLAADPCLRRFTEDLGRDDVAGGVAAGLWRIDDLTWPHLTILVTAGDNSQLCLRVAVDGYPAIAPGGQPWDLASQRPLSFPLWPAGPTAPQVFRQGMGLYMAADRAGLGSHAEWATNFPSRAWNPARTIGFYLREVHHELRNATMPSAGQP